MRGTLIMYDNGVSSGTCLIKHSVPNHQKIEQNFIKKLCERGKTFNYNIHTKLVWIYEDEDKVEVIFDE